MIRRSTQHGFGLGFFVFTIIIFSVLIVFVARVAEKYSEFRARCEAAAGHVISQRSGGDVCVRKDAVIVLPAKENAQ